ncbi:MULTISPECIES: ATP-binding protein [Arthrobacter]|uniref:PspC domain-containing protein n=2 Tax=Arthrobacter TaxID=1663 RepID=A0ABU9KS09_9MICC|nr:ATP-binding protein [Arthrobacter sp. YJM1]MDP5228112.1 PspC domain-containing protein [Arthrobacter sp. YJM1]
MNSSVQRPPLVRGGERMIAGVCSGLAAHLGWPVRYIRAGMVLAAFAGGAGVAFYGWLWLLVPTADEKTAKGAPRPASVIAPAVSGPSSGAGNGHGDDADRPGAAVPGAVRAFRAPFGKEILLGAGLLLLAATLIARQLGADVPLGTLIAVAAILGGAAIAWMQLDESRRDSLVDRARVRQAGGWGRLLAGLALVMAGVLVMVSGSGSWQQTWLALLASVAVLGGVALVLLPWGLKFWKDLEAERAARVRETERAEIAAHLHDSVLQTLALIQRRASAEQDVIRLARSQERELRTWLFGDHSRDAGRLADRIRAVAAEVEDNHGTPLDVVCVGDTDMTGRHEALVQAAREAMLNAARHGGGPVSVYLECSGGAAEVFVKDRGPGFDLDAVPDDRLGVKESIIGRMKRHGGTAAIMTGPGGTEVRLRLPAEDSAEPGDGDESKEETR